MRLLRHLQHWLGGTGPSLEVADFVPDSHPIRLWADTFPWQEFVKVVRQTERHLLTLGQPLTKWVEQAQGHLQNAMEINSAKRERLTSGSIRSFLRCP